VSTKEDNRFYREPEGGSPHVFQASYTDPSGIRVNTTILVPAEVAWPDVREVGEIAQMTACGALAHIDTSRARRPMPDPDPAVNAAAATPSEARRPDGWPPLIGDIWEDNAGNRWVCTALDGNGPYPMMVCLARSAHGYPEYVWSRHGPMTKVAMVAINKYTDEEPPF